MFFISKNSKKILTDIKWAERKNHLRFDSRQNCFWLNLLTILFNKYYERLLEVMGRNRLATIDL